MNLSISKLRYKRAQMSETMHTLMFGVLAIIALISLLALGVKVFSLMGSQQDSEKSFATLVEGVTNLVNHPNATTCHASISFRDHHALVGFGKGISKVMREGWIDNDEILRPISKCPMDSSCLLVCDVGGWYVGDNDCENYLLANAKFKNVSSIDYVYDYGPASNLIYYGSDGPVEFVSLEKSGSLGDYSIRFYNRAEKISQDSKPCASLNVEEDKGSIRTLGEEVKGASEEVSP